MSAPQQPQRVLIRFSAVLAVVGAFLAAIANGLHPHLTNPTLEEFLTLVAERDDWTIIHFMVILAVFLILGGLFGVNRSIQAEPAAGFARLGFAIAIAGVTMVAVNVAGDGFAMKTIATQWATTPEAERAALMPAAEVLSLINLGTYTVWIFLFLGLPFVLYGLALIRSTVFPRWMGWLALVSGIGCTIAGTMQFVAGETELLTTLFVVFSVAITVWVFLIGLFTLRNPNLRSAT